MKELLDEIRWALRRKVCAVVGHKQTTHYWYYCPRCRQEFSR